MFSKLHAVRSKYILKGRPADTLTRSFFFFSSQSSPGYSVKNCLIISLIYSKPPGAPFFTQSKRQSPDHGTPSTADLEPATGLLSPPLPWGSTTAASWLFQAHSHRMSFASALRSFGKVVLHRHRHPRG